jgi:hypothetical protein
MVVERGISSLFAFLALYDGLEDAAYIRLYYGIEDGRDVKLLGPYLGLQILGFRYSALGLVLVAYSANLCHVQWHAPRTQLVLGHMNTTSKVHHTCQ